MKTARIAAAVEEGDKIILVLGEGDHTADRWQISEAQMRKLLRELFEIESRGWFRR